MSRLIRILRSIVRPEERGADNVKGYLSDATSTPAAYKDPLNKHSMASPQSTITVAWNAAADFETNLERIITQKWIAIFPLGTEAWTEHRRLLPAVVDNSGGAVNVALGARRLPYPVEEYTENPTNLQAAVSALNGESVNGAGDTQGTRVWWDRKNLN